MKENRLKTNFDKNHHAFCLEGDKSESLEELYKFIGNELGVKTEGNPDFLHEKLGVFGIDEARRLKELETNKAFGSNGKIFIIESDFFTHEAQNSLLKMLEEPTGDARFFIVTGAAENLLPTLRSRLAVVRFFKNRDKSGEGCANAVEFLRTSLTGRLEIIKNLVADIAKEKKTKTDAIELINKIERFLYEKTPMEEAGKETARLFDELEQCREYLNDRSASVKMILDYTAMILPVSE